jgi:hypothetical protein
MIRNLSFISLLYIFLSGTQIDEEKLKIAKDFKENYLGSEIKDIGWTGNTLICSKGKLKDETYQKILQRINYFRRMAGVYDTITLDENYNKLAQAAALIMYSNNILTHNPSSDLKCYSEDGDEGAGNSNLSLIIKNDFSRLITDEMGDDGASNGYCGHRSWILYSKRKKMGFGATLGSYALQVSNTTRNNKPVPNYYSCPSNGFVPFQIVYKKWSFFIPCKNDNETIDFSKTKVEMKIDNKQIKCSVLTRNGMYGDNSIVWTVGGLQDESAYSYYSMEVKKKVFQKLNLLDTKISVKITNVKIDNKIKNYEYEVQIFDPMTIN